MKLKQKVYLDSLGTACYDICRDGITASLLLTYLTCKMKFAIAVNLFSPVEQKSYFFGTLFHALCDEIYVSKGDMNISKSIDRITAEMNSEGKLIGKSDEEIDKDHITAKIMAEAYIKRYKKDFIRHNRPEVVFDTEFSGYRLRGKVDLIYTHNGKRGLMEHKNFSQILEDVYPNILSYDTQLLFYVTANEPIDEIYYNINRAPMHKIGKKESIKEFEARFKKEVSADPNHFFKRYSVIFTKAQKEGFKRELVSMLQEIKRGGPIYRNRSACEGRKYNCPHIASCANGYLIGCKKRKTLFEELK